jgi:hypothetical protein
MSKMERPEALRAHSGRVDIGLRNRADSTHNSQHGQACLEREHLAVLQGTRFADMAPLVDAGVGWREIAEATPAHARCRVVSNTKFEFDDEGGHAFVLPVRVDNALTPESADPAAAVSVGAVVDLLAFHPDHPHRWALYRDVAEWLGSIPPQYLDPEPVPVWRSPLSWLCANCRGVVLLSDRVSQYRILSLLNSIIAEDEQHADELRRVLAQPWPAPQVILSQEGRRAA